MARFPGHLLLPGSKFRQEIVNNFQEEVAAKEQKEQAQSEAEEAAKTDQPENPEELFAAAQQVAG